ncbi:MAG: hypothetical protein Q9M19_07240 [Mariprofundaceae bacterium]|nr:hypothetical protein [Mariprofundaceae bacterium]
MSLRYLETSALLRVTASALKPELLLTTALTIMGAVVLFGVFGLGAGDSFASLFSSFVAIVLSLLWLMLGLTALAHQLNTAIIADESMPNTVSAYSFAWARIKPLLLLPAWGVGGLLLLLLLELLLLSLANIPGLGTVWLAIIAIPLLVFNTLVAILLMLSAFNIAAYVARSQADLSAMKDELWQLVKAKFTVLLVYNLGGILLTLVLATLVLAPLWLGAQASLMLAEYAANQPLQYLLDAVGFWGSLAHLLGLIMGGLLLAAIGSVPIVMITHMTLLVHLELDADAADIADAANNEQRTG